MGEEELGGNLAPKTLPSARSAKELGRKGRIQVISWEYFLLISGDHLERD